jgi:hypothetical protein
MAHLTKCRVCGGNASSEARSCPHCGDPYVTDDRKIIYRPCPFMSNADKKEECSQHCHFFLHAEFSDYKMPFGNKKYHGCFFGLMLQYQYKIQVDIDSLIKRIKPKEG